jgi:flagellar biosynthetic protein FliP
MMTARMGLVVLGLVLGAPAGGVLALEPPPWPDDFASDLAPPGATAAAATTDDSLPEIGDLLTIVDKATSPQAGGSGQDWSNPVRMALVFAALAILPTALVMMTSFTRIVIVLSFVRRALTTQSIPPTIAIVGLSLFLTLFTMAPTLSRINADAVQPYLADKVQFQAAMDKGIYDLKEFMIKQTRQGDLALFVELAKIEPPTTVAQVPAHVAIPAFAISEFRTAFEMGCLIFIPFLLVDLVISGILLSAGMMMLPPSIISLPFKIILFVLVDGWRLLALNLVTSYR